MTTWRKLSWLAWVLSGVLVRLGYAVAAPTLYVSAPPIETLTAEAIYFTSSGENQRTGPIALRVQDQPNAIALPALAPNTTLRVTLRDSASKRIAQASVDPDQDGNYSVSVKRDDFFRPTTLRIMLNNALADPVMICQIAATDSQHLLHTAEAANISDVSLVDIPDLPPGTIAVSVTSEGRDAVFANVSLPSEGGVFRLPVNLNRFHTRSPVTWNISRPIVETSGPPQGVVFRLVSVVLFVLAVVMWSGSIVVVTLLPQILDLEGRAFLRRTVKVPLTASGLILLGNGIGLLVMGEAQFLSVVSAVCAVQLALIFWLILAVLGGRSQLVSMATLGVIAGMAASVLFIPSLVLDLQAQPTAHFSSLVQISLVLVSIVVMAVSHFKGWLREEARRSRMGLRRVCERCGEVIDPISGRCGCTPVLGLAHTEALGRLTIRSDSSHLKEVLVGTKAIIGREPGCDVYLEDDPRVSRRHAMIYARGKSLHIRDLSSSNGTFINGQRVSERSLRDGDEIRIGDSWMLFESV